MRLWLWGLLLPALLLGCVELGFHIGRRPRTGDEGARMSHGMIWESAMLAMLGLLIGFTFAMAVSRFDMRRRLVTDEANAIRTTLLRARFLEPPAAEELQPLLRRYVGVRIAFYDTTGRAARDQTERESSALQQRIWSCVAAAALRDPQSNLLALLTESATRMIELEADRRSALEDRVPVNVLLLLVIVAATAVASIGYACGLSAQRLWFGMLGMPLLIAAMLLLVLDLATPWHGLIHTGQESMVRLANDF
jgi:hypothetical protein